jgi:hypothetical protein
MSMTLCNVGWLVAIIDDSHDQLGFTYDVHKRQTLPY